MMIDLDPGALNGAASIVAGAGVGLAARQWLKRLDMRRAARQLPEPTRTLTARPVAARR